MALNRNSILQTTSSTRSQAELLHLPIHLLVTTDTLEVQLVTPTSRMEASTLIAGQIASRARILPLLNNTIGDQIRVPLQFSSRHTPAMMHPLRLHPSTLLLVRVLVAGKTVKDRPLVVRTVPTPHSHQGPLRRGRVTILPDLHLQPTSDPTIDILLPHLQRRPLSPDQTELHPQAPLRTAPVLHRPLPRPHDPLNLRRCLKATSLWRRNACREMTAIFVK